MVATMITGTSKKNSRCVAVSAEVPYVDVSENTTDDATPYSTIILAQKR